MLSENRYIEQAKDKIAKYGWAVQGVFADPDNGTPQFAYTAGLYLYGHPELCIVGLPMETMQAILNSLGERVRGGETLRPGERMTEVVGGGLAVQLVPVDLEHSRELLTLARVVQDPAPDAVQGLQVVWPDKINRLPWEPGYDIRREAQPIWGTA